MTGFAGAMQIMGRFLLNQLIGSELINITLFCYLILESLLEAEHPNELESFLLEIIKWGRPNKKKFEGERA